MNWIKENLIDGLKIVIGIYLGWLFVFYGFDSANERFFVTSLLIILVSFYSKLPEAKN